MGLQGTPEKRQKSRARRRPTLASSISLRHLLLVLAGAVCILSAWAGHTVGMQTALGVSRAASRAFGAPDAKKALATSKKLPVLEAALRRVGPAHALTAGFTALLVSLLFLYVFRKLFVERVEAASDHLRRASRAPDQVGRLKALKPGTFDTREVLRLHSAVNDGLADLDLRNRGRALVQATDARLQGADEAGFLSLACGVLQFEGGGVGDARAYITRSTEDERAYLIEAQGEAQGHAQSEGQGGVLGAARQGGRSATPETTHRAHDLVSRSNLAEIHTDAVIQFLKSAAALHWQSGALYLRTHLTSDGSVSLVTVVTPGDAKAHAPIEVEHLCTVWASEVARGWHQLRFQDLTTSMELSQQLQRKWIQSDAEEADGASPGGHTPALPPGDCIGFESMPSRFINGDFLAVFRLEKRNASLVVLGDVTGAELRAGLAATGCVAALSDRFDSCRGEAPHLILDALMRSLNRYMWASYRGALGLRALGVYFSHDTGQGALACFGQPFPYILSPVDRKPMVLLPAVNPGMMGLAGDIDTTATTFQLLAGQVFFACTEGILATQDLQGKRFEKMIQRGTLADICQTNADASASVLLSKLLEAARAHAGNASIRNDLTAVALKVMSPTRP